MTSSQKLCLLQTRQRVYQDIDEGKLKVMDASRILGLSRQAIWRRRKLVRRFGPIATMPMKPGVKSYQRAWNRTDKSIEQKVCELRKEYGCGPTTISWHLEEEGIRIHRQTVYRILVRNKLIHPKSKVKREYQRYTLGYPGAEVQFDFTQIEDSKERFWLAAAVDDHTRWGFCKVYDRCTSANAQDFLSHIIKTAPFPIQAVRTDQGSEVSIQFSKECIKRGVLHIKNRVKTPRHNGKVERFHRTVQEECLWKKWHWRITPSQAKYRIALFLDFYNYHRRHQGLGMNSHTPFSRLSTFIYKNRNRDNVKRSVLLYNH